MPSTAATTSVANGCSRINANSSSSRVSTKARGVYMRSATGQQRGHDCFLHVQAVFGFIDGDAGGGIHYCIRRLDVTAQRQAVAEEAVVGQCHLGLVDNEVLVCIADRLFLFPTAKERKRPPTLRVR